MPRLINPFEGSPFDRRHADIVMKALKRGRRGEGVGPIIVDIEGRGATVVLGDRERKIIASLVDSCIQTANPIKTLGEGMNAILEAAPELD